MRYFIFICLSAVLLTGCKQNKDYDRKALAELEKNFESNPVDSTYDKLLTSYLEIMQEHKDNKAIVEEILYKASQASKKMDNCRQMVIFLNNLIKNHYERQDTPDNLAEMIRCLRKIDKAYAADILAICFGEAYPNHPSKVELMAGLQRQQSATEFLAELAKSMFPDTGSYNKDVAFNYVDACEAYALVLPHSEKSPEFLFSAAQTAKLLQTYDKCISIFDWIIEKYPTHPKAENASFMKAFLFDNDLKDTAVARKFYVEFISKYPKSEFVDDAQILIQNLGKSEEEILEEIQRKNQGAQ
ncbi:MAG: hypothetical protein IPM34_09085 [Saprospiraceae bacterium]|nr:hypothetical protein [Saprospiraceae bacterium]